MPNDTEETQPTAEESAAADQAAEDGFASAFEGPDGNAPLLVAPKPEDTSALALSPAVDPTKKTEATPPADAPVDPYAGLPQAARDALAKASQTEHQLSSLTGRFNALQRQLQEQQAKPAPATAPAAPAPPAAPEKPSKREAVRGELPEVAEAMDELEERFKTRTVEPPPPPPPAVTTTSDDQDPAFVALTKVDPDWQNKLRSTDFELWLLQQKPDYANDVRNTGEAAIISAALARFDVFHASARTEQERKERDRVALETQRQQRAAAAAERPRGRARAADPPADDEQAAFVAGFEGT